MIHENELVMLLLSIGVFIFILFQKDRIKPIPEWKILISGFLLHLCACLFTVMEGFFWEHSFNYLEHGSYAGSSFLFTLWCWKIFCKEKV